MHASQAASRPPAHSDEKHSDEIFVTKTKFPLGPLLVYSDRKGLVALDFPGTDIVIGSITLKPAAHESLRRAVTALDAYFNGGKPLPRTLKSRLDGTEFQKKVWAAIETIPLGKTRTYGEIAAQIGHPGASRAVGAACGANPLPLFVPCHRVLAANGKIGGFTGGLEVKRRLLQHEGVTIRP